MNLGNSNRGPNQLVIILKLLTFLSSSLMLIANAQQHQKLMIQTLHPQTRLKTPIAGTTTTQAPQTNTWIENILIQVENSSLNNEDTEQATQTSEPPNTEYSAFSSSTEQDELLADSNNVSVAILSSSLPESVSQPTTPKTPVSCEAAYTQCALRKACAPALKAYNDNCYDLIYNKTSSCSQKCLKAMIALRSTEIGDDLMQCNCLGNEYCEQSKERSLVCQSQVDEALNQKSSVSCSTASSICLADQSCSVALEFYYRNCQSLLTQKHCSMRCNNSLAVLYRQPKASKLINCHCDGSEEFPCVKYKTYTERYCLNQTPNSVPAAATEEDDFNMTSEPRPPDFSSQSIDSDDGNGGGSNNNNGNGHFNDEDEYEDPRVAATGTGGDSFNGIQQTEEDVYIPLMSGRYFSNLHQRQQHQQQQQATRRPQPRLAHSSRHQSQNQKNVKSQRARPANASGGGGASGHHRIRFSRLMLSASSSSSAPLSIHNPYMFTFVVVIIFTKLLIVRCRTFMVDTIIRSNNQ